ncbi:MAG: hypothetical protein AUK48_03455 [Oscillatoriales cyanobacterium CG2_30_44_21]|nr:MAG: hypothetical protein AUK48_03455 [Oscillatoriales cyanobacterium CG2_30_44_21]
MNSSSILNELSIPLHEAEKNPQVWGNLKQLIATSSGFDKWQRSRITEPICDSQIVTTPQENVLDDLVRSYLRETLETLAY